MKGRKLADNRLKGDFKADFFGKVSLVEKDRGTFKSFFHFLPLFLKQRLMRSRQFFFVDLIFENQPLDNFSAERIFLIL